MHKPAGKHRHNHPPLQHRPLHDWRMDIRICLVFGWVAVAFLLEI